MELRYLRCSTPCGSILVKSTWSSIILKDQNWHFFLIWQGSEHRRLFSSQSSQRAGYPFLSKSGRELQRRDHSRIVVLLIVFEVFSSLFARKVGPWIWPKMFVFSHIGDLTSKGIWKSWTLRDFFRSFLFRVSSTLDAQKVLKNLDYLKNLLSTFLDTRSRIPKIKCSKSLIL